MFNIIFKNIYKEVSNYLQKNQNFEVLSEINLSNDNINHIDKHCERIFLKHLRNNNLNIIGYISEDTENFTLFNNISIDNNNDLYICAFDALNGSSNYLSNMNTGSIYGIYKYDKSKNKIIEIVESGYCLFGIKSIMVYTFNDKLIKYDLNNDIYLKDQKENKHKIYSINQSYTYDPIVTFLINQYKSKKYKLRWTGTLVADVHRIIINGGIFYYPYNDFNKKGKIRLIYESIPLSFIFKTINGIGLDLQLNNILDKLEYFELSNPHKKSDIILSTDNEYNNLIELYNLYDLNKN